MDGYIKKSDLEADLIRRGFYPAIVKGALEEMPCADVVEVVRCKDCRWVSATTESRILCFCDIRKCFMPYDSFCDDGIRKENEDDKIH